MKKTLIVAYYYPPASELRTLKFTKYLPQFGFKPYILTARNRSVSPVDTTLLEEVPPEAKVIATLSAEHRLLRAPNRLGMNPKWYLVPDAHVGWLPFAVFHGAAAIRKEDIDIILATGPVFTTFLIGYFLKRITGKPLVLDYRDPWTQSAFLAYPTALHRKLEERMEASVLRSADYVVTTTEPMTQRLVNEYPFIRSRCATIPNGLDSDDFRGLTRSASTDRLTITYAGKFYGLRTPEPFLTAIKNFIAKNTHLHGRIRVVFAGPEDRRTLSLVRQLGLKDVVELTGFIAHREGLQLMIDADVLLLVMSRGESGGNGTGTVMIPGKVFEYLAARRPILALAPEGAVCDLIRRTGSGTIVPPDSVSAIESAILALFRRWEAGSLCVEPTDISVYERKALTARLATVLESLCNGGGG